MHHIVHVYVIIFHHSQYLLILIQNMYNNYQKWNHKHVNISVNISK